MKDVIMNEILNHSRMTLVNNHCRLIMMKMMMMTSRDAVGVSMSSPDDSLLLLQHKMIMTMIMRKRKRLRMSSNRHHVRRSVVHHNHAGNNSIVTPESNSVLSTLVEEKEIGEVTNHDIPIIITFPKSLAVDDLLLQRKNQMMSFYPYVQMKIRTANMALHEIGTRIIQYEIQCLQEGLRNIMISNEETCNENETMIPDRSLSLSISLLLSSDNYNTNPDTTQSTSCCSKKKKRENGTTMNQISEPDMIQSHFHHEVERTNKEKKVKLTEEIDHLTETTYNVRYDNNKLLLLFMLLLKQRKQQLQQQKTILYQRSCRLKRTVVLIRRINMYHSMLYWEIQSHIDNLMK